MNIKTGIILLIRTFAIFIMLIAFLAIGEGYLHSSGYIMAPYSWSWTARGLFEPDNARIYRLSKEATAPPQEAACIGCIKGSTDSLGFRADPYDYNRMEKPVTLFMMGDSFTYGSGMNNAQTYPYFAQKHLHGDVDVVNAGVPGYGLDQTYLYAREVLDSYRPDYLVWNINVNDIDDANDACLFKEIFPGYYMRLPAWLQALYWQGIVVRKSPKFIQDSLLVNLFLRILHHGHERYTLGCTLPYDKRDRIITNGLHKLTYFIRELQKDTLGKKTKILYVLMPGEFYFDVAGFPNDGEGMSIYRKIVNVVREEAAQFLDLNEEVAGFCSPQILAQRQENSSNNLSYTHQQFPSRSLVLGVSMCQTKEFFLQNEYENQRKGKRHMSVLGNEIDGQLFAETFINRFYLPRSGGS